MGWLLKAQIDSTIGVVGVQGLGFEFFMKRMIRYGNDDELMKMMEKMIMIN